MLALKVKKAMSADINLEELNEDTCKYEIQITIKIKIHKPSY